MTLYVGIDVAKHFHLVAVIDPDGEVLHTRRIDNDAAGYAGLD